MSNLDPGLMPLSEIVRLPRNAKSHDLGALHTSYGRWGFLERVIVNRTTGRMIAGHGRVDALQQQKAQGQPTPDRIQVRNGQWLIPVDYVELPEDEEEAAAVALNRLTELGGWDDSALAQVLADLAAQEKLVGTGYDEDDLDELLRTLGTSEPPADVEPQFSKADELLEKWGVQLGQVWRLGEHRLACGDCVDKAVVERVMDGQQFDLLLTDPPYGINIVQGLRATDGGSKPVTMGSIRGRQKDTFGGVKNMGKVGGKNWVDATLYAPVIGDDKPFDPAHLLEYPGEKILFGGNYFASKLPDSRCWIVWDKNNTGNFADAELAWTSFDRTVRLYQFTWNGLLRGGERAIEGVHRVHPTQKPVGLFGMILTDFSEPEDVVADFYIGSGTTLIACQQLGRKCRAIEISEKYCSVVLERMATAFPDLEIEKLP